MNYSFFYLKKKLGYFNKDKTWHDDKEFVICTAGLEFKSNQHVYLL